MEMLPMCRLQYVTAALAQSVTRPQVSRIVLLSGMAALKADRGVMSLLTGDGSLFQNVQFAGYSQRVMDEWPCFPADAALPLADAVRRREVVVLKTRDELRRFYPHLTEVPSEDAAGTLVAVPILHPTRDRALGGLGLNLPVERPLDEEERAFLLALADLCGQALEHVWLAEAVQRETTQRAEVEDALESAQGQCRRLKDNIHLTLRQHQAMIAQNNELLRTVRELREQGRREHDENLDLVSRITEDLARAEDETRQALARQQTFLRDILASATGGKLRLCLAPGDLPLPLIAVDGTVTLSATGGIRELRRQAQEAAMVAGLPEARVQDLETAVGEAALNAVVHGGDGRGQVSVSLSGTVQVRVEDQGTGITLEHLPHATLACGWSTKSSFGHGMKMMIQTADRVHLLTGDSGTTVVLEQDRMPSPPSW